MKLLTMTLLIASTIWSASGQSFKEYGDYSCSVKCTIQYGGHHPNTAREYINTDFRIYASTIRNMSSASKQDYLQRKAQMKADSSCRMFCSASWDAIKCTAYVQDCIVVGGR